MILETIAAWTVMGVSFSSGGGWAAYLSPRGSSDSRLLIFALTPLLSAGALTVIMLWLGLLGIPLQPLTILPPFALFMAAGWALWWHNRKPAPTIDHPAPRLQRWQILIVGISALVSGAVLLNAAIWPLSGDDARLYYWYGIVLRDTQALVPLQGAATLHEAYPMHIQMLYSFSVMISSWRDEYLARFLSTVLSLACLPATYLLGKALFSSKVGWISLGLLALSPTFADWASTGYADLPTTAYFTLGVLFLWRTGTGGSNRDALLCGVLLGLATWTKNAALPGAGLAGLALLWMLVRSRVTLPQMLIAGATGAVIAAPWYVRNILQAGMIIPPTAWTDQAQPSIGNLLVFITRPELYAFTGIAIVLASALFCDRLLRRHMIQQELVFLLWLILPYFAIWWLFASYDPRFLLLILPFLAIFAAAGVMQIWEQLPHFQTQLRIAVVIVAVGTLVYVLWDSIEFKTELLQQPFMSHEAKIALVRNGERILPNLLNSP